MCYFALTTLITPREHKKISEISDGELQSLAEELFKKSSAYLYRNLSVKYQGRAVPKTSTDNALEPLFNVPLEILAIPTVRTLVKLFDNYEDDVRKAEGVTEEERLEETEFINSLLSIDVMLYTMDFLSHKGFFEKNLTIYEEVLKRLWFYPYSRSSGVIGSSGFEHVFLAEKKPRKGVVGFHNWIFFSTKERSNKVNYLGFTRKLEFADKFTAAELHMTYDGKYKMSTMFIGTPPELEVALYTLCFFGRPNRKCKVSFSGVPFSIQTYVLNRDNTTVIGSAYPVLYQVS
ncbi:hypothetical protein KM043_005004 [Ampulex compressa]|nr:hypothetical protein KM043_005004 [Ampulex compressa]